MRRSLDHLAYSHPRISAGLRRRRRLHARWSRPASPPPAIACTSGIRQGRTGLVEHWAGERVTVHRRCRIASARAAAGCWSRRCGLEPGIVLAQYVPGAFGARGLNVPFCRWLARLRRARRRRAGHVPRAVLLFRRSPARGGTCSPSCSARWRPSCCAPPRASITRPRPGRGCWRRYGPQTRRRRPADPVDDSGGRPRRADVRSAWTQRRGSFVIGHFGTYGDHVGRELARDPARARAARLPDARVLLVGSGGEAFARRSPVRRPAIASTPTGRLSAARRPRRLCARAI